jgi:hypothetical protein
MMSFTDDLDLFREIREGHILKSKIPGLRAQHLYPSGSSVVVKDHNNKDQVIGGCNRKQYLQFKQEPPSDSGYVSEDIGPAEVGNLLQDYVEKEFFEKANLFLQSELQIYLPQWNVSGRADTILQKQVVEFDIERANQLFVADQCALEPGDIIKSAPRLHTRYFGVEVKSKDGYFAEKTYIRPNKTTISSNPTEFRPQDDHIIQTLIYLYAFKNIPELAKFKLDTWFIFYVLRGDGRYNYFKVQMTGHTSKHGYGYPIIFSNICPDGFVYKRFSIFDVIRRWEELNFCIEYNILPNRDFTYTYSRAKLDDMLISNSPDLSKENKELVKAGRHSECVQAKGTANERPLGDFECYACQYKSKCWGLGNYQEGVFDTDNNIATPKQTGYSEFDPFKSAYFDELSDEDKIAVRTKVLPT